MSRESEAAGARRLDLRVRPDLEFRATDVGQRGFWTVKDPVALAYHQLGPEEYFLLRAMDGRASIESLTAAFRKRFAPRIVETRQIVGYLARLHEHGLVITDAPGQAEQLADRRDRRQRLRRLFAGSNLLAIRLPGVDPTRVLDWMLPRVQWMGSRWALTLGFVLIVAAVGMTAARLDELMVRLPEVREFASGRNLVFLAAALGLAKIVHEFAHALTCRSLGAECHRMGILLLVFVPCLYCDVSDSWMLPKRWQRITIAAAGMAAELVLAAICTLVWWASAPGFLNTLCFNMMIACSVTTLMFNVNPLLRYDGYYMLSDSVRVANLWERSRAVVWQGFLGLFFGLDSRDERAMAGRRGWLAVYGICSMAYRLFVLGAILWWIRQALGSHGLERLADLVIVASVGGLLAAPLFRAARGLSNPSLRHGMSPRRSAVSAIVFGMVALAIAFVPVPMRIDAPVVVEASDAETAYVTVPGRLISTTDVGQKVAAGDTLAVLENLELELEVIRLRGMRDRQRLHLTNLERIRAAQPEAGRQIPAAREALDELEQRLVRLEGDLDRLTILAQRDGVVLPAARQIDDGIADNGVANGWSGLLQDPVNAGCYLDVGTVVCEVGDTDAMVARAMLHEGDVGRVRAGQQVRLAIRIGRRRVVVGQGG